MNTEDCAKICNVKVAKNVGEVKNGGCSSERLLKVKVQSEAHTDAYMHALCCIP